VISYSSNPKAGIPEKIYITNKQTITKSLKNNEFTTHHAYMHVIVKRYVFIYIHAYKYGTESH